MSEKVAITGIGPVSPLGIGREEFFSALREKRCAVGRVSRLSTPEGYPVLAAEIGEFNVNDYLESAKTYLDPISGYLLAACALALRDGGFDLERADKKRVGVSVGSMFGALQTSDTYFQRLVEKGPRLASSLLFSHTYVNTPGSLVAIEWGLMGYNATYCSGLTSGAEAIIRAADALAQGRAEAILAGGTEALCELVYLGLANEGRVTLAPSPAERAAHPGLVPGEGAGVLLLEAEEAARARGAQVAATICGRGQASDTSPAAALERAVKQALSVWDGREPDIVISPANGEPQVDEACRAALPSCEVFCAKELQGETFAAATGLDVAAALALAEPGQRALVASVDPAGWACALALDVGGESDGG